MKLVSLKYTPLMAFQLVLLALFYVFVKFPQKPDDNVRFDHCPGFSSIHVMVVIGFGFLMTFPRNYCYSALGFNLLLAAMVAQWALLCQNFFHMTGGSIMMSKKLVQDADIMVVTVLITFGVLLGVTSDLQLLFIAIVETFVASANLYLVSHYFKAVDRGRSISVHTFGAYFGLGVSIAFRNRKEAPDRPKGAVPWSGPNYFSDVTSMLGSLFLWVYWPFLNSAGTEHFEARNRVIAHSYSSLAAAAVTTFFLTILASRDRKLDMLHIQNSTLAGGVAIGSICDMLIGYGCSAGVGVGSAFISFIGYKYLTPYLERMDILDTCGVHNRHGMPGVLSGLLSVLAVLLTGPFMQRFDFPVIFPTIKRGGRTTQTQAMYQFFAVAATLVVALTSGFITGIVSNLSIFKPVEPRRRFNDKYNWELP